MYSPPDASFEFRFRAQLGAKEMSGPCAIYIYIYIYI